MGLIDAPDDFDADDQPDASLFGGVVLREATHAMARSFHRRVGREMLAAWMAGYDSLTVIVDSGWPVDPDTDPRDLLTLKAAFVPSYGIGPPTGYPHDVNVRRYDLTDMTRKEADRLRDKLKDDDPGEP